jgi:hypothetical protein
MANIHIITSIESSIQSGLSFEITSSSNITMKCKIFKYTKLKHPPCIIGGQINIIKSHDRIDHNTNSKIMIITEFTLTLPDTKENIMLVLTKNNKQFFNNTLRISQKMADDIYENFGQTNCLSFVILNTYNSSYKKIINDLLINKILLNKYYNNKLRYYISYILLNIQTNMEKNNQCFTLVFQSNKSLVENRIPILFFYCAITSCKRFGRVIFCSLSYFETIILFRITTSYDDTHNDLRVPTSQFTFQICKLAYFLSIQYLISRIRKISISFLSNTRIMGSIPISI